MMQRLDEARNRNRRKGDEIPDTNSKHVSMRVKSNPLLDVHLHVPNTSATSSVANRDAQTPHQNNVTSRWTGASADEDRKGEDPTDGVKEKEIKNKNCLENEKEVEEDDEPPELIIRDDDSSTSEDEKIQAYKHVGLLNEPCRLEQWADEMIEMCQEAIKKERSEKEKEKKKEKEKEAKSNNRRRKDRSFNCNN